MTKQDSVAPEKSAQRVGTSAHVRDTSAVGLNPVKRDAMGAAMRVLTKITGSDLAERFNLRQTIDRVTYEGTKTGFKTLGAATRADSTRYPAVEHPSAYRTTPAKTPTTSISPPTTIRR
ncbi:hypothetical protein ABH922_002747 [Rhodococcus sp. 27YEA15]